jgi:hypothetical protein
MCDDYQHAQQLRVMVQIDWQRVKGEIERLIKASEWELHLLANARATGGQTEGEMIADQIVPLREALAKMDDLFG